MYTLTHLQPATASLIHRLMLLVLVAGVVDPDVGRDRKVLQRIEVLFQASSAQALSHVTPLVQPHAGARDVDHLATYAGMGWRNRDVRPKQAPHRINLPGFYSSHIVFMLYTIPHQNADEDDSFVYPPAAA